MAESKDAPGLEPGDLGHVSLSLTIPTFIIYNKIIQL